MAVCNAAVNSPTASNQNGVCEGTVEVCNPDACRWEAPNPEEIEGYETIERTCDGLDNDCDGQTDEGAVCRPGDCRIERNINETGLDIELCTIVASDDQTSFWMGCHEDLNGGWSCRDSEIPQRQVAFRQGFDMMRSEVTEEMYRACVEAGHAGCEPATECDWGLPNYGEADASLEPIVCVSQDMAEAFADWVGMRLPSEAEWEYAARGTMGSPEQYSVFPWRTDEIDCSRANYAECDEGKQDVCSRSPTGDSPFGLCDMAGNVWERTQDCWHSRYDAGEGTPPDGRAWQADCEDTRSVFRGGSASNGARACRAAARVGWEPRSRYFHVGFRLARTSP